MKIEKILDEVPFIFKNMPLEIKNSIIFHAGTIKEENDIISNGGRVIACTGIGDTISESLNISYELAKKIDWEGKYYRKDIGKDLINKNK